MSEDSEKPAPPGVAADHGTAIDASKSKAPSTGKTAFDYWGILGKAGIVIALLIGLITLYKEFNPAGPNPVGPRLLATCKGSEDISEYIRFGMDRVRDGALQALKELDKESLQAFVAPNEAGKTAKAPVTSKKLLEELVLLYRKISTLPWEYRMRGLHSLRCNIVNDGTEPAMEVELHLPGIFRRIILNGDEVEKDALRSPSIAVGNAPVGPTTTLEVWTNTFGRDFDSKNIFLNYRGGKGKVDITQRAQ